MHGGMVSGIPSLYPLDISRTLSPAQDVTTNSVFRHCQRAPSLLKTSALLPCRSPPGPANGATGRRQRRDSGDPSYRVSQGVLTRVLGFRVQTPLFRPSRIKWTQENQGLLGQLVSQFWLVHDGRTEVGYLAG